MKGLVLGLSRERSRAVGGFPSELAFPRNGLWSQRAILGGCGVGPCGSLSPRPSRDQGCTLTCPVLRTHFRTGATMPPSTHTEAQAWGCQGASLV